MGLLRAALVRAAGCAACFGDEDRDSCACAGPGVIGFVRCAVAYLDGADQLFRGREFENDIE